tara:strand:+ start:155 stop:517 length:363 start_codon:yes stop_codon:yes gene_type:complete
MLTKKEAERVRDMLAYFKRLGYTKPMLNLHPTDGKIKEAIKQSTAVWFEKEADDIHELAMDNFLKAMFTVLAEKKLRDKILLEIKKLGGVGYKSGGIHGKYTYHSDTSRVDGRLIRRKRR